MRVLVSARKFKQLSAGTPNDIEMLAPVDLTPRQLQHSVAALAEAMEGAEEEPVHS